MQGAVFLAPNSASCVPQEAVIPLPHHPSASSGYVAVLSPAYFYLLTALQVIEKKEEREMVFLFIFLQIPQMFNKDSVKFRGHVLLKCGNIFNYQCCGVNYRASSSSTPVCEEQHHCSNMLVNVLIS